MSVGVVLPYHIYKRFVLEETRLDFNLRGLFTKSESSLEMINSTSVRIFIDLKVCSEISLSNNVPFLFLLSN